MAFKTFAPGVLTSSDVNTFLMRQSVITCTSGTRPASPNEGMTIYETDTDRALIYTGTDWQPIVNVGAWTSYTASLTSIGSGTDWALGNGTITVTYSKVGRLVAMQFTIVFGSTTTFGTKALGLTLPFNAVTSGFNLPIGQADAFDVSPANTYQLSVNAHFTNTQIFFGAYAYPGGGAFTTFDQVDSTTPFTWASTDRIEGTIVYRSAS